MIRVGTRIRNNQLMINPDQGTVTRSLTRDLGMKKNVTGSFTFVNSTTKQIQGAASSFSAFAVGDEIMIEGTNLNNGFHTVVGIDTVSGTYLTLAASPKNEGPITCTVRTA
jgi:hypothetical protein